MRKLLSMAETWRWAARQIPDVKFDALMKQISPLTKAELDILMVRPMSLEQDKTFVKKVGGVRKADALYKRYPACQLYADAKCVCNRHPKAIRDRILRGE